VAERGWQALELTPLSLCDGMAKLLLGRASAVSATPSMPTFTSPPRDCCSPSSARPCSPSLLFRMVGQERGLPAGALQSEVGAGLQAFQCCKTDWKFRANSCTHLSESRGISSKPVVRRGSHRVSFSVSQQVVVMMVMTSSVLNILCDILPPSFLCSRYARPPYCPLYFCWLLFGTEG